MEGFSHTCVSQITIMNKCAQCSRAVNPKRRGVARDCEKLSSGERPLNSDGGDAFKCMECFITASCPWCGTKLYSDGKVGGTRANTGNYKALPSYAADIPAGDWSAARQKKREREGARARARARERERERDGDGDGDGDGGGDGDGEGDGEGESESESESESEGEGKGEGEGEGD